MEPETLAAQAETTTQELSNIKRKMHFTGTVLKTMLAGAVIDIGQEVPGVVHISQLREEPVNRVEDVLHVGQTVEVWVRRVFPKKKRVELTMIKPLDLEWREIEKDMVLKGKVTRLEKFGVFVDVGAERSGLVHISEMTHGYIKSPGDLVKEGDEVEVKVLDVNRKKKQIKLSMKALEEPPVKVAKESPPPKEHTKPVVEEAEEIEEPAPTAMAMAMREAMERSKERGQDQYSRGKKSKTAAKNEEIFERTLQNRSRSGN